MSDDNKDKPSFFSSWPPPDGYHKEDDSDDSMAEDSAEATAVPQEESLDLSNILKPLDKAAQEEPATEPSEEFEDAVPDLEAMFGSDDEEAAEPEPEVEEIAAEESIASPIEELAESKDEEQVVESHSEEQVVESHSEEQSESPSEEQSDEAIPEEVEEVLEPVIEESQEEPELISEKSSDDVDMEALFGEGAPIQEEEEEQTSAEEVLDEGPSLGEVKAYASYDYTSDELVEDLDAEEEGEEQTNNKVMIAVIIAAVLLFGWFGFNQISSSSKKFTAKAGARRNKTPKSVLLMAKDTKEQTPVWEITSQKYIKDADQDLLQEIQNYSGRPNPFAIPASVIAHMREVIERKIKEKPQAPGILKKRAYRATLTGVLTSDDNVLALVQYHEAEFEVQEGTAKDKVLKEATKAMNKAKAETLEVLQGDYIGPWKIDGLDNGKAKYSEAYMMISHNGDERKVKIGQQVELGIFNDKDQLDVFAEDLESEQPLWID